MIFSTFAQQCSKIEAIRSRLAITELVAQLLQESSANDIGKICYLLQGRVVPLYEPKEFGIADKFMIRAIAQATDHDVEDVLTQFRLEGDLGIAAQKLAQEAHQNVSVEEVFNTLYSLTELNGPGSQEKKVELLAQLIRKLDALSVRYIVRIPLGKLRLGFSDMTILDALSWMITGDKTHRDLLEQAYNVYPDISFIATTVKEKGVKGLEHVKANVGVPILSCLCQRIPTAQEMIDKMGMVSIEPKYDGVRVQIHIQKKTFTPRVVTFSRNLEQTTDMFPEVQNIVDFLSCDTAILDAEAVGIDPSTGEIMPFQDTTTRRRKHGIEQAALDVPIRFYIFDILLLNNKDVLNFPLEDRRNLLETLVKKNSVFQLAPHILSEDPKRILEYHEEQRNKGLEGVVVKKWNAPYEPGRKGYTWVKLKEQEGNEGKLADTLDTVVMGYYRGEGKRSAFGIGAFLVGIKHGDKIRTVSKIGTGVSDQQWKDLKILFDTHKTQIIPKEYGDVNKLLIPDVWLDPYIVVEIAGDDITKSPNHSAGYAIRFPRLIKIRNDKSVKDITTDKELLTFYKQQ